MRVCASLPFPKNVYQQAKFLIALVLQLLSERNVGVDVPLLSLSGGRHGERRDVLQSSLGQMALTASPCGDPLCRTSLKN